MSLKRELSSNEVTRTDPTPTRLVFLREEELGTHTREGGRPCEGTGAAGGGGRRHLQAKESRRQKNQPCRRLDLGLQLPGLREKTFPLFPPQSVVLCYGAGADPRGPLPVSPQFIPMK